MGLSGLEIYKLLPKTNCKKCGFPTCLAFAMALAQKRISLDKCPDVSEETKKALESASEPPIRLVTVGTGERKLEIGNETVMFRHDEKFYHPTGIGFIIEDSGSEESIKKTVLDIKKLEFERVGQKLNINLIAIKGMKDRGAFLKALKIVTDLTDMPLILINESTDAIKAALEICKGKRPLIGFCNSKNIKEMAAISKANNVPLIVESGSLELLEPLVKSVNEHGVKDLVLYTGEKPICEKIWDLTLIRRMAIRKSFRPFGYPTLSIAASDDLFEEAALATTFVAKYASICLMKHTASPQALSVLTARQNIYTDPQKPLQVEPKIYEIGRPDDKSPVLVTTNFSLTYYTVEAEVEASKKPSYIVSCDSEGMSVLTAWAAEKFTAESIAKMLKNCGIKEKVSHNNVVIPGYVAVLSGKLEEESGWNVKVGPREASGIPVFLRNLDK